MQIVAVANVAPTAAINGAPGSSPEGTAISLTSSVTDPGQDTHSYAWSVKKDGVAYGSAGSSAGYSFTPNDNGSYVVSLEVTDSDGATGSDQKTITVTNVNPVANVTGDASVDEGSIHTYSFTVTDAGAADSFTIDSGYPDCDAAGSNNGAYVANSLSTNAGGGSFQCSFPDGPASANVKIKVSDDDGGSGDRKSVV